MIGLTIFAALTAAFCWFVGYLERHRYDDGMAEMDCLMDEYMDYLDDLGYRPGYEYLSFEAWYHETYCTLKLPPAQVVPRVYR